MIPPIVNAINYLTTNISNSLITGSISRTLIIIYQKESTDTITQINHRLKVNLWYKVIFFLRYIKVYQNGLNTHFLKCLLSRTVSNLFKILPLFCPYDIITTSILVSEFRVLLNTILYPLSVSSVSSIV